MSGIYPNWLLTIGTGPGELVYVDGLEINVCTNDFTCSILQNEITVVLDQDNYTVEICNV